MFRLLPPAGAPVKTTAVFRAALSSASAAERQRHLRQLVGELSGQSFSFFFNSGKAALLAGLKALSGRADASRDEVIIPAYTCYTVPAAIVRAGLKVRPVDIDPNTMDYDYQRLARTDFSRVLVVIGDNLFGIPSNWTELKSLADKNGVFLIDDAAQAMGLQDNGRPAGSHGDFGFYSLGRGKNLSTFNGGILVTDDDELAQTIQSGTDSWPTVGSAGVLALTIKLILLSFFLRPRLYWIPSMMPFLGLGETVFDRDFAASRLSSLQVRLAANTFYRLDEFNDQRRENAKRLATALKDLPHLQIPGFSSDRCPAYLRLPVLLPDEETRTSVIGQLRSRGISASTMYPDSIDRIEGLGKDLVLDNTGFPGARKVVDRLVTLPTHPYVTETDIDIIIKLLSEILVEK